MEKEFASSARQKLKVAGLDFDPSGVNAMDEIIRFGVRVLHEEQALEDPEKIKTAQESLGRLVDEIARVARERNVRRITPDIVVAGLMDSFCGIWPFCRPERRPAVGGTGSR